MPEPDDQNTLTQTHALTPERFARIRAIFEAALERKPAAREAYVDGACGADILLRKEVLRMLAAEARPDALLDAPTTHPPSTAPEEGRFPAGTTLAGRYRILGMLGRGGMGEVYKAHDLILNQAVALKFLSPAHISEAALIRFRNEVRIARQVSHPNVCRVYDLGMVEGLHFLSMEYIDGEDLASLLRRIGRLPQDKAIEFTRKICAGLGAAHERGVLHRDLKPANIMIDGRGQVRITDFGLAALAAEIPLSDIRSGTPAYMSPEQKAGKEVTTRSDIYSLGLVLFEMFTGKQRKTGTDTNPTEIVKDLDPAIERLILRCLDEEPKRRPAAAINVAMGLPGADPIAAALAAGETPSPEMVAASEEKEGFSPRAAILCFVGMVAAILLGLFLSESYGFLAHVPFPLTPDVLADRSRQFLTSIGYTTAPADSAWSLDCCDHSNEEALKEMDAATRNKVLASHQPAVIHFWYRQSLQPFANGDGPYARPTEASPPNSEPGMILVALDATGRLLRLQVQPWTMQPTASEANWPALFAAAGLDFTRFHAVTPTEVPPMAVDAQFAWEGTYTANRTEPVTVQAASWRGRPVLFELQKFAPPPSVSASRGLWLMRIILLFGTVMAFFAWRNWRSNRWDRRGATVLVSIVLAFGLAAGWGFPAFAVACAAWVIYVGVEPLARRYFPDALISWSRACQGQWRNPLVASHVLVALLANTIMGYLVFAGLNSLGPLPAVAFWQSVWFNPPLPHFLGGVGGGLLTALVFLTLIVVIRLAVRNQRVADLLASLAFTAVTAFGTFPYADWQQRLLISAVLFLPNLLWIYLVRYFGFLSLLVFFIVNTTTFPPNPAGWLANSFLPYRLVPVAIGGWALWVILSAQRSPSTESEG